MTNCQVPMANREAANKALPLLAKKTKACAWLLIVLAIGNWALFIAPGCARIVPPDGGAKDSAAPLLVKSIPAPGSVNFHGKKITLEFSEAIAINTINTQLLIAPVMENPYNYSIRKGNILELQFEKPFPENATVNLNFRDAVKDITEGNLAKDLVIAFATGPVLDTHAVAGQVRDLFTGAVVGDGLVGLWPIDTNGPDTTSIIRQKPSYLTRTDKEGGYVLRNLRRGRYFLAAFQDKNGNSRWNGKQEAIGFPSDNLNLLRDSVINLNLAPLDEEKPRIFSLRPSQDSLGIATTNEGLVRARVVPAGGSDSLPMLYDVRTNRITFKLPKNLPDSAAFLISLTDSARNRTDTLVGMRLHQASGEKKKREREEEEQPRTAGRLSVSISGGTVPEPGIIKLDLSEPSATAQPLRPIRWKKDTLSKPIELKGYFEDYFRTHYLVQVPRLGYLSPKLLLDSVAFRSRYSGLTNRADTVAFTILNSETAGLIRGTVKDVKPPLIIELLDEQGKRIDTIRNTIRFEFRNLNPANYRIRIIEDKNNNGIWDQGSYQDRRQPERIIPYPDAIKVKANWEVELE